MHKTHSAIMEPTAKLTALPPELMVLITSYLGGLELFHLYLCGSSALQHLFGPRKGVQAFGLKPLEPFLAQSCS